MFVVIKYLCCGECYLDRVHRPALEIDTMKQAFIVTGRMRIRYGVKDMGAYERFYEGTMYTFDGW